MSHVTVNNEAEILTRVIAPGAPTIPADTARLILTFDFEKADRERMEVLAEKAQNGELTAEEQAEMDSYERVGHFLSLIQSKARISLKQASASSE